MLMTEAAKKYDVDLSKLCKAVTAAELEPVGERQGKRKKLKEYDEKEIVDAILAEFKRSYLITARQGERYKQKANRVIAIYRKSHPKQIVEDDL